MMNAFNMLRSIRRFLLMEKLFLRKTGLKGYTRLAGYAFRKAMFKDRTPLALMIALTYDCQCLCVHCSTNELKRANTRELDLEELTALVDSAAASGVIKLGFTGGEPLLREGFTELVRRAADRGVSVSLDTNGWLLTREKALELKKAGIAVINISLDSAKSRVHDRLRRLPGSFEKAAQAVGHCAELNIPCVVSTYATNRSLGNGALEETIKLARRLGADAVRVMFPIHTGRLADRKKELLSLNGRKLFFEELLPRHSFVYSESPLFDFISGRVECSMRKGLSVYITASGDLKGCYASDRVLGNVRATPLAELLGKFSAAYSGLPACNVAEED